MVQNAALGMAQRHPGRGMIHAPPQLVVAALIRIGGIDGTGSIGAFKVMAAAKTILVCGAQRLAGREFYSRCYPLQAIPTIVTTCGTASQCRAEYSDKNDTSNRSSPTMNTPVATVGVSDLGCQEDNHGEISLLAGEMFDSHERPPPEACTTAAPPTVYWQTCDALHDAVWSGTLGQAMSPQVALKERKPRR